jgi:SNF2 family DNA or RNA helicase
LNYIAGGLLVHNCHRAKSAQGVASKKMGELARLVSARLGLSGTPLPHDPLDAWAIYRFLAPSIFPRTLTQMRQRYTRPALRSEYRDADVLVTTERGGALVFHKLRDLDDLERKMYRIAHRVRTEDVVDLPPYEDRTVGVTLEPAARKVYRDMEHDLIAQVRGGTVTAANAAIRVLRLQQITGGWLHEEDEQGARTGTALRVSEAKEKALADFLADVGDEPVVVFGRFHTDLDSIHEAARAAAMTSVELSGRTTQLDGWQRGEARVLAVQVQSGSEGIDLTRSRICVYYSLDYNWATWQQSRARVLRPGQSRAVQYVHLIVESSIDQMVLDALHRRGDVISQIVERLGS